MILRFPLPSTEADEAPDVRLTDPSDLDVYMIGASGAFAVGSGLYRASGAWLAGSKHRDNFVAGESGCTSEMHTTDEMADRLWAQIQRGKGVVKPSDGVRLLDNTPLMKPSGKIVSGQLEQGLSLYAVPKTEVGRCLLGLKSHAISQGGAVVLGVAAVRLKGVVLLLLVEVAVVLLMGVVLLLVVRVVAALLLVEVVRVGRVE